MKSQSALPKVAEAAQLKGSLYDTHKMKSLH